MADKPIIVVVDDTLWKSIARDAVTFLTLAALTLFGWWIGSVALEWVGVMFAALFLFGRQYNSFENRQYTPEQARAEIDRIEKEAA
jgi:uncharacterized membrane protein YdjX (TVP38/TMEM64 family)